VRHCVPSQFNWTVLRDV